MPDNRNDNADFLVEAGSEVLRGNVALWLGPDWQPPGAAAATRLARISWLAVWSESTDSTLASALSSVWPTDAMLGRRVPVEVPGRLSETLGSYFALSEICPIFYLSGRADSGPTLLPRDRRRARDEQIDVVGRLNGSVVLLAGFSTAAQIIDFIRDELPAVAVRLVVVGLPDDEIDALAAHAPPSAALLGADRRDLTSFLDALEHTFRPSAAKPRTIRVGSQEVDLGPLFEREHPIDQDFLIVTTEETRPPGPDENRDVLLDDLVAGRALPWRAFAHNLHWHRDVNYFTSCLGAARDAARTGSASVACLNVCGEAGSGLTTLMLELGFRLSLDGLPVLVVKPSVTRPDYDTLRVYLEYVSQAQSHPVPAVLVYDDSDVGFDERKGTSDLLTRLASDGRHVLMLRSVAITAGAQIDTRFQREKSLFRKTNAKVSERWLSAPLRASLTVDEQASLVEWAASHWSVDKSTFSRAVQTWGADWPAGDEPPPLLVCLYSLLRDHVTSSVDFGRHLFGHLRHLFIERVQSPDDPGAVAGRNQGALSGDRLANAVALLQQHFRRGGASGSAASRASSLARHEAASLCVSLAALGCLRVPATRAILESVAGLSSSQIHRGMIALEQTDLVRLSIDGSSANDGLARRAYYTDVEVVGFRHPVMARLLLDWVLLAASSEEAELLACAVLREIVEEYGEVRLPAYPIRLLKPLFRRLKPTPGASDFVEVVSTRFLRLQKLRGSDYHRWQWTAQPELLDVLGSLPEVVARQSAAVLHTRGITRYKSCGPTLPLAECRRRYEQAEADLRLALERAREAPDGERPVNIVTSQGLMYQGWARQELDRGSVIRAGELRETARQCLREGLRLSGDRDNPYAAYGLAALLVEECERESAAPTEAFAGRLAEALDLLQMEPEDTFEVEWLELKQKAIELLGGTAADSVIASLRSQGDELGLALEVLRVVGGEVPVDASAVDLEQLRQASELLDAGLPRTAKTSPLVALLRYAVSTLILLDSGDPQFGRRHELIRALEGTRYLERPIWLFDYAMLSLQVGSTRTGLDAFRRLRAGGRFLDVPLERARFLSDPDRSDAPRTVRLRVVRLDGDKGWARVTDPNGFTEPVPFAAKVFRAVGSPTSVGATMVGRLRIRPSGPSAEPLAPPDSRQS